VVNETEMIREVAKPLVEYIRKHYTPMTTVIVTGVSVEVFSTDIQVPFDDEWD